MRKLVNLLLVFVLVVSMFPQSVQAKSSESDTLIIGDSICYGMSKVKGAGGFLWLAEGGVCPTVIDKSLKFHLGECMPNAVVNTLSGWTGGTVDIVKEVKSKNIKNIIYNLGGNGTNNHTERKWARKTLKRLKKKLPDCNIYYMTKSYVVDSLSKKAGYKTTNADTKDLIKYLKKSVNKDKSAKIIDLYKTIRDTKKLKSYTSDGVHYWGEPYQRAIKMIKKKVK